MPSDPFRARTLTTLCLLAHCICIFIVLSANFSRSPLQSSLVSLVAPYARPLNFDPNFTQYYLTHGHIEHDDHSISAKAAPAPPGEPLATPTIELPDVGFRGGLRRHRYQVLSARIAYFANRELDTICAEFVKAIGAHFLRSTSADRFLVACRVHRAQPRELDNSIPPDPFDDVYQEDVYAADVWVAQDDTVQLLKRSSVRDSAPAAAAEVDGP